MISGLALVYVDALRSITRIFSVPLFGSFRITSALAPDVRHRNLARVVIEIVAAAVTVRGRLLLIIEDVQWMNLYSMKLLLQVGCSG